MKQRTAVGIARSTERQRGGGARAMRRRRALSEAQHLAQGGRPREVRRRSEHLAHTTE